MTLQHVYRATVVAFAFGVMTVGPAYAQRRDGNLLPQEKSGQVTAVGCLVRGSDVRGGKNQKYLLAHPKKGPVASVPEATCTADPGADALDIDNEKKAGLNDSLLGRWVEVRGKLEKETSKDPNDLREIDVVSFKIVPVVPPRVAARPAAVPPPAARPRPTPQPQATAAPAAIPPPAPTTEAQNSLPKTASQVPAIGLAALLLLAGGLILRSFRFRQQV